jgi:hypothetical protein
MTAHDNWLEKPYQDAYAEQEASEELVEELLADECNIQNPSVFLEAINEGACLDSDEVLAELKIILERSHSYAELGELVWDAVSQYCEATATDRAESIIQLRKKSS